MSQNSMICPGFRFSGLAAGLKKNGKKDLGLIASDAVAAVAGVFTTNRVQAACVQLNRQRIRSGKCRAVVVNSGNANCCTGEQGVADNQSVTRQVAAQLGVVEELVLSASTGVIGEPLPVETIGKAVPSLVESLAEEGLSDFSQAIMTTDTMPKVVIRNLLIQDKTVTIAGVAKGSGMIRPDMATMLCFICTDASADSAFLQRSLTAGTQTSFNRITVDGDTSTNDMVLLLANGISGATIDTQEAQTAFQKALDQLLLDLARMIVKDGEGATKLVTIAVEGAASDAAARKVAETVAHSSLVKTALFGEDANWGRIIAAAGRAGVEIDPDAIDIFFDQVCMAQNGMSCGPEAERRATEILKKPEFIIRIDLKQGKGGYFLFTCDFSVEYVKINADYRS